MVKMKRILVSTLLSVSLILGGISPTKVQTAYAKSATNSEKEETIEVGIYLYSESNLIFSRYNILVQIDGKELCSIENGDEDAYIRSLKEGKHCIHFEKAGDASVSADYEFDVSKEQDVVSVQFSSKRDSITVGMYEEVMSKADVKKLVKKYHPTKKQKAEAKKKKQEAKQKKKEEAKRKKQQAKEEKLKALEKEAENMLTFAAKSVEMTDDLYRKISRRPGDYDGVKVWFKVYIKKVKTPLLGGDDTITGYSKRRPIIGTYTGHKYTIKDKRNDKVVQTALKRGDYILCYGVVKVDEGIISDDMIINMKYCEEIELAD